MRLHTRACSTVRTVTTSDDAPTARPSLDDAAARQALSPLLGPFLPWSSGAMRPTGLLTVLNDVWFRRSPNIVELGSGVSTVILARLLHELGAGQLLAVEHDQQWADRVEKQLGQERLNDVARVVRAPLRPSAHTWDSGEWYDEPVLLTAVEGTAVDVLVVDGPPAWRPGSAHARFPALDMFAPFLAPGATVVLDDVERDGERDVLQRWSREHAIRFDMRPEAGIAVGTWPARTRAS